MTRELEVDHFESKRSSRSWHPTSHDVLGVVTHELIAWVASSAGGSASPDQVVEAASRFEFGSFSTPVRQVRKARATTLAARYFRRFGRPGWTFVGSEIVVGDVALDLLWEKQGAFEADEIKSGFEAGDVMDREARVQAQGQAEAGRSEFGSSFRGVRLVLLTSPASSSFVSPDGVWT